MSNGHGKRTAAALLLTRGEGEELEVFLVDRAPELRFFGGYLALPGGVQTKADLAAAGKDHERALQGCALRELFEETGLLLHELPPERRDPEHLARVRRVMVDREAGDTADHAWRGLVDGLPQPALRQLCRVMTPPFAPVRYDTAFYHVPLDRGAARGQEPSVWHGELVGGRFWRAGEALDAWRRGEALIVPPVLILLELLAGHAFEEFARELSELAESYRQGHLHRVRFSPGIVLAALRTPTLPPATTTNCYIIGEERLFVVDPASPHGGEQERLSALLSEMRGEGRELAGILVTHHHRDHVGGVVDLSRRFALPVHAHSRTLERLPEGFLAGDDLADGDGIELGRAPDGSSGWLLRALFTPGHDQGHLCFREDRYDAVIVGDMLSTVSTIVIDPPEGHLRTYLDSLRRLLDEPMTTLYPSHGPALRDGHRLVRHYLRHRETRETALLQALEKGGGTIEELLPAVYWDVDKKLYPFATRSLLAGLQKLEEESRATHREGRWELL